MPSLPLEAMADEASNSFKAAACPRCGCARVVRKGHAPPGRRIVVRDGVLRGICRDKADIMTCTDARGNMFLQEVYLGKAGVSTCRAGPVRCALRGATVSTDRLSGYVTRC